MNLPEKKSSVIASALESDVIFNYYGFAITEDNEGIEYSLWKEGENAKMCKEQLSRLFDISEDDVVQEYANRL